MKALAALVCVYVLAVLAVIAFGGTSRQVRAVAGFVPDCLVFFTRLSRDPALGRARRAALLVLVAYLALPFDLIPDFIPVAGQLDDAVLVLLVLRFVLRGFDSADLAAQWPGPEQSLRVLLRVAGRGWPAS